DSTEWRGRTYTESGTYRDTVRKAVSGVSDSIYILHLTIHEAEHGVTDTTVCDSFSWHGVRHTVTGDYQYNVTDANGCYATDTLHLTVNLPVSDTMSQRVCDTFTWRGNTYDTTGTYLSVDASTIDGHCDTIHVLRLVVDNDITVSSTPVTVCDFGEWRGNYYLASGEYRDTIENAVNGHCDSIYVLELTVNHPSNTSENQEVCDTYTWHENVYGYSGSYLYLHTDDNGCTSVDTLRLQVHHKTYGVDLQTACAQYDWNGTLYTATGFYTDTLSTVNGCDSVVTLGLTIHNNHYYETSTTACDTFVWRGSRYVVSGEYRDTVRNAVNSYCDSIYILHLSLYSDSLAEVEHHEVCDHLWWRNTRYNASGSYRDTVHNAVHGVCDSVYVMTLAVYHNDIAATDTDTSCGFYTWRGNVYRTSGEYRDTVHNAVGGQCDSVFTLHLTVYSDSLAATSAVTVCNFSEWRDSLYTEPGLYFDTVRNAVHGYCDSIYSIDLRIRRGTFTSTTQTACDSYTWHDNILNASGTYMYLYDNEEGCASFDTLHLTINRSLAGVSFAVSCDEYIWHDETYTTSGTYVYRYESEEGCASADTLHLTLSKGTHHYDTATACEGYEWHGQHYGASGIYTYNYRDAASCPSTDTLYLTLRVGIHNVFSDTACDSLSWHGVTYTESGNYWYEYRSHEGCASADTLHLTLRRSQYTSTTAHTAAPYLWHDSAYIIEDTYVFHDTTVFGCEWVDTLHLFVHSTSNTSLQLSACDSYQWHDNTYTQGGAYIYRYIDSFGVPSADTLFLTIGHSSHQVDLNSACDSFAWRGTTYTASGIYLNSYVNEEDCPSVDTLHLTIRYSNTAIDSHQVCDSFIWINGKTYYGDTLGVTHTLANADGCDSVVSLVLSIRHSTSSVVTDTFCAGTEYLFVTTTYNLPGYYVDTLVNASGCDSVTGLNLVQVEPPQLSVSYTYSCESKSYQLVATTDASYLTWNATPEDTSLSINAGGDTLSVLPSEVTTYTVLADHRSTLLCPAVRSVTVTPIAIPKAVIRLTPEFVTIDNRAFVAFDDSYGTIERKWFIDNVEQNSVEPRFTYSIPTAHDSVTLSLMVHNGLCTDTASVVVPVVVSGFFAPNVFIPSDDANAVFKVSIPAVDEFEISIYNRQGLLVFRSTNIDEAWDGTHSGTNCQGGAYVYTVHYTEKTRPGIWQKSVGSVLLLR
ncbi:MAG: gliding motility-associated C-terminal domain-containing protein, partial [Bacteroidales bacterium]|nr:gliding motility-associated C-terminal domain-containing protein [Bacteroidales bacterium]